MVTKKGSESMDILKGKRYDVMDVLWKEERPLSAFEINELHPEMKMPTIRRCLELLLKENIVKVAGMSMNGKVYARNYVPLLTREDYLKESTHNRKIGAVEMLKVLLEDKDITVDDVEELQKILDRKKAELGIA